MCSRARAIAVPMLGASCCIMSIVYLVSWSKSAGDSGFSGF